MSNVSRANIANSRWLSPNLISHLIPNVGTNGEVALLEMTVRVGGELPLRTHLREHQFFYVLEGNFVFEVGGKQIPARQGSFVWVPKGVEHGFKVYLDKGKVLLGLLPGTFEGWLFDLSSPAEFLNLPPRECPSFLLNIEGMVRATRDYGVIFGSPEVTVTHQNPIALCEPFSNHRSDRKSLDFGNMNLSLLAASSQTNSRLTAIEVGLDPEASSPLCRRKEMEMVYILEGQARYQIHETMVEVGAGTTLKISSGAVSGYRNIGLERLRTLHFVCGRKADKVFHEPLPFWVDPDSVEGVMASHGWTLIAPEIGD